MTREGELEEKLRGLDVQIEAVKRKLEALESGTYYGDVKTAKANWRRRLKVMEEQRANLVKKQKSN